MDADRALNSPEDRDAAHVNQSKNEELGPIGVYAIPEMTEYQMLSNTISGLITSEVDT